MTSCVRYYDNDDDDDDDDDDVLCQYENFCIRDPGAPVSMNNFGSTPLFNIFTVDQASPRGPRGPPPTSYSTTNFKDSRVPAYPAYR